jgi:hypothetical protein
VPPAMIISSMGTPVTRPHPPLILPVSGGSALSYSNLGS